MRATIQGLQQINNNSPLQSLTGHQIWRNEGEDNSQSFDLFSLDKEINTDSFVIKQQEETEHISNPQRFTQIVDTDSSDIINYQVEEEKEIKEEPKPENKKDQPRSKPDSMAAQEFEEEEEKEEGSYQFEDKELDDDDEEKISPDERRTVQKLKEWIAKSKHKDLTITKLAGKLHVSASTLKRTIEKVAKQKPKEFINRQFLITVKRVLKKYLPMQEASTKLGFRNAPKFSRWVKRYTQKTPTQLQKQQDDDDDDKEIQELMLRIGVVILQKRIVFHKFQPLFIKYKDNIYNVLAFHFIKQLPSQKYGIKDSWKTAQEHWQIIPEKYDSAKKRCHTCLSKKSEAEILQLLFFAVNNIKSKHCYRFKIEAKIDGVTKNNKPRYVRKCDTLLQVKDASVQKIEIKDMNQNTQSIKEKLKKFLKEMVKPEFDIKFADVPDVNIVT